MLFVDCINGHAVRVFPHLVIPFKILSLCTLGGPGTLDLINMFLILACLLKAVRGGLGKTSTK